MLHEKNIYKKIHTSFSGSHATLVTSQVFFLQSRGVCLRQELILPCMLKSGTEDVLNGTKHPNVTNWEREAAVMYPFISDPTNGTCGVPQKCQKVLGRPPALAEPSMCLLCALIQPTNSGQLFIISANV